MENKDTEAMAIFNLITETIKDCFVKTDNFNSITKNIKFANSKLLSMYCDCSDIFEHKKLRKKILDYQNKNLILSYVKHQEDNRRHHRNTSFYQINEEIK